jgi:hypothetical protein
VTEVLSIASENVTEIDEDTEIDVYELNGEVEETVGAVVSITNELIFNVTLLLELSVTVIVQFE